MKRRVVKLTESDLERLVKRIIKEQGDFDWADEVPTSEGDLVYLSMAYFTEYSEDDYVEGLVLSKIPRDKFIELVGTDDIEEIVLNEDNSYDIMDEMLDNYDISINSATHRPMPPEISSYETEGVIGVISKQEYEKLLIRYS